MGTTCKPGKTDKVDVYMTIVIGDKTGKADERGALSVLKIDKQAPANMKGLPRWGRRSSAAIICSLKGKMTAITYGEFEKADKLMQTVIPGSIPLGGLNVILAPTEKR